MKEKLAKSLIDELEMHPGIIPPNKNLFMQLLNSIEIKESSQFDKKLPNNKQDLDEPMKEEYHHLFLRRILRNANAGELNLSPIKKIYEKIITEITSYSSDRLRRNIRTNSALVKMMVKNSHPFSLLGKFQTYSRNNPEKILYRKTQPILIIPKITKEDREKICLWESEHTTYEKEKGILHGLKAISRQEYLSI